MNHPIKNPAEAWRLILTHHPAPDRTVTAVVTWHRSLTMAVLKGVVALIRGQAQVFQVKGRTRATHDSFVNPIDNS